MPHRADVFATSARCSGVLPASRPCGTSGEVPRPDHVLGRSRARLAALYTTGNVAQGFPLLRRGWATSTCCLSVVAAPLRARRGPDAGFANRGVDAAVRGRDEGNSGYRSGDWAFASLFGAVAACRLARVPSQVPRRVLKAPASIRQLCVRASEFQRWARAPRV